MTLPLSAVLASVVTSTEVSVEDPSKFIAGINNDASVSFWQCQLWSHGGLSTANRLIDAASGRRVVVVVVGSEQWKSVGEMCWRQVLSTIETSGGPQ